MNSIIFATTCGPGWAFSYSAAMRTTALAVATMFLDTSAAHTREIYPRDWTSKDYIDAMRKDDIPHENQSAWVSGFCRENNTPVPNALCDVDFRNVPDCRIWLEDANTIAWSGPCEGRSINGPVSTLSIRITNFVSYITRNVPKNIGCMIDTYTGEIQCPLPPDGCWLKGHDPALDQQPVPFKPYSNFDDPSSQHFELCSGYDASVDRETALGKMYAVKVDPPICEETMVTQVYPADKACQKGEFGPPSNPGDGDLHGCSAAGAGGISYTNGKGQVGAYNYVPAMENSKPGDKITLCLVEFTANCTPGDGRGTTYTAFNHRTHGRWRKPNGSHACGGA